MHYNSKSKRVLHNIKVVHYAGSKNVGNRATEYSQSLKVITTVKWVHTRALLHSHSVCFFRHACICAGAVFCQRLALMRLSACRPSRCCMHRLPAWSKRPTLSISVLQSCPSTRSTVRRCLACDGASRNLPCPHRARSAWMCWRPPQLIFWRSVPAAGAVCMTRS